VLYNDSEKWAWWTLGVVALIIAAYGAFVAFLGHGPVTVSVFALLALTAFPASSRRHFKGQHFDEREREIASKAVRAGFTAFWVAFIGLMLAIYFIKGRYPERAGLGSPGNYLVGGDSSYGRASPDDHCALPRWTPCLARNRKSKTTS
jgi:uncharacterized membrane protein